MIFLNLEHFERRLGSSVEFNLEDLRTADGSFAVEVFLYQQQDEVQKGVGASVSVDTLFFGDELVDLEIYIREKFAEPGGGVPMRRASFAFQDARGGEQEGPRTDAGDLRSGFSDRSANGSVLYWLSVCDRSRAQAMV